MIAPGLGERVRAARLELGLSQRQVAAAAALSRSEVILIEAGKRAQPRLPTLRVLATALDTTVLYLRQGVRP